MSGIKNLTLNYRLTMTCTNHYKWNRNRFDPFNIVTLTNVVTHVIKVINRAPEITYARRAPEGRSKIILDINGFGGAPRV